MDGRNFAPPSGDSVAVVRTILPESLRKTMPRPPRLQCSRSATCRVRWCNHFVLWRMGHAGLPLTLISSLVSLIQPFSPFEQAPIVETSAISRLRWCNHFVLSLRGHAASLLTSTLNREARGRRSQHKIKARTTRQSGAKFRPSTVCRVGPFPSH